MRRAACIIAAVAALAAAGCGDDGGADAQAAAPQPERLARVAADRFLDRYLDPDGRVVRHDQGGDTVGEGQAYALLLAAATGDERRFDLAWRWTRRHLQRDDHLLAHRWAGGRIADREAATDADLDAAHALVVAAGRFDRPGLRREARRIARSVLARETVRRPGGRRALVAGPWARSGGVVNPSYFAPRAYRALAGTGRRASWRALRRQATSTTRALTRGGRLPPDWARVGPGMAVKATPPPGGGGDAPGAGGGRPQPPAARYGFDAVRVPIRFAVACEPAARRVAARLDPALRDGGAALLPRERDGSPAPGAVRHAVALVGAAGAARAAGDSGGARALLARAQAVDRAHPSYYGAAWVALGRVLLSTGMLGRC